MGILEQINQSKPIYYSNHLTKEMFEKACNKAFEKSKENNKWVVKYNGAIDDNGAEPEKVQINYVAKAVEALLNDKKISNVETKSIGCQIRFRK